MILNISQHIYSALSADETVNGMVSGKIYPMGTKTENKYPFIAYDRDDAEPTYTKDGMAYVRSSVTIMAVGSSYRQALDLANAIVHALDGVNADYEGFKVTRAIATGAGESFVQDAFVQEVNFRYTLISK